MERGEFTVTYKPSRDFDRQLGQLKRNINRLSMAVVFAAFLVAGTFFYLNDEIIFGIGFMGISLLTLFWMLRR
jgi:hypothetical protein